jgi:hypothetical protein
LVKERWIQTKGAGDQFMALNASNACLAGIQKSRCEKSRCEKSHAKKVTAKKTSKKAPKKTICHYT